MNSANSSSEFGWSISRTSFSTGQDGIILGISLSRIMDLTPSFRNSCLMIIVRYQCLAKTSTYCESYVHMYCERSLWRKQWFTVSSWNVKDLRVTRNWLKEMVKSNRRAVDITAVSKIEPLKHSTLHLAWRVKVRLP